MWWSKTRDLVVETCTIVRALDKDFKGHVADGIEKYDKICEIIKECHESCPESEKFQAHTKEQNGTLKRMERKYDTFYSRQDTMETTLEAMKTAKKTKKELFAEIGKIVTVVCFVLGSYFAYQKHSESKRHDHEVENDKKIEVLLENVKMLIDK